MAKGFHEVIGVLWCILAVVLWIKGVNEHGLASDIDWIKGALMFVIGQIFFIRAKQDA